MIMGIGDFQKCLAIHRVDDVGVSGTTVFPASGNEILQDSGLLSCHSIKRIDRRERGHSGHRFLLIIVISAAGPGRPCRHTERIAISGRRFQTNFAQPLRKHCVGYPVGR
jgi:hypothetical protein